jgi:hypothetical protein
MAAIATLPLENCAPAQACWKFNFNDQKCQFTSRGLMTCWRGEDVEKEILIPLPLQHTFVQGRLWNNSDNVFWERELTNNKNEKQRQLISFQMSQHKILWIKMLSANESSEEIIKN